MNNEGTILGACSIYVENVWKGTGGVYWKSDGTMLELATLGTSPTQTFTAPKDINEQDQSVGYLTKYLDNANGAERAVRWASDGSVTELLSPVISGLTVKKSHAVAINDNGLVVGDVYYSDKISRAVLWTANNVPIDLNSLIDPQSGWVLNQAVFLSNSGYIAGYGTYDADGAGPEVARKEFWLIHLSSVFPSGDTNGDGMVDVGDLGILAANYGQSGKSWTTGDFNNDGLLDVGDLGILAANYGKGNASASFAQDYDKVFHSAKSAEVKDSVAENNAKIIDESPSTLCSGLGLPLIAALSLASLLLVKLEE